MASFASPASFSAHSGSSTSNGLSANSMANAEGIEIAGRTVEKMLHGDGLFPSLQDKLRIGMGGPAASLSGLLESDYPTVDSVFSPSVRAPHSAFMHQRSSVHKVPLPPELVEQFSHIQCNCMIGLFPEIDRAWLTIDSDIYVWRFEDQKDLAYFDGLSDAILSASLLQPKPNIFRDHIRYLLCLTTAAEIVLLGVTFSQESEASLGYAEMQLLPEPLFSISTDSTHMLCVKGTAEGRIFLGGKDGCLYEFAYKSDDGWFGKKVQKINHSTSTFSFFVPAFVNAALSEEDPLVQLEVDDSRHILYSRSEKGTIQVFDLGPNGSQLTKIATISQQSLLKEACKVALNVDKSNFYPIVGISSIENSESLRINLVAISSSGVRFYFSTTSINPLERPSNISLQHIRLPPGFAASTASGKPSKVHMSYYKNGALLLTSALNDNTDQLWLLSGDSFPYQPILMETQSLMQIDGRVWAMEEIPSRNYLRKLYKESFGAMEPPMVTVQHFQAARKFILVSSQGSHIVSKLRPVDQLRQLLIENNGPDNDAVKSFFTLHTEIQALCTCLVLACSQAIQDSYTSEWATRALFLYGGEPRLIFPQQRPPASQGPSGMMTPGAQPFSPGQFHPNIASTPASTTHLMATAASPAFPLRPDQTLFGGPVVPEMHFSNKHNALYLYLSRLIRPVWLRPLVMPSIESEPLKSSISSQDVGWMMSQMFDLKNFMEKHGQLLTNPNSDSSVTQNQQQMMSSLQDAFLRERQSLLLMQHLLNQTLQVLGLWRVVTDHQFHEVVQLLTPDKQNELKSMYFRDLIISAPGQELCSRLIQCIINLHLGDNSKTDAISNRLIEVCPSLYNNEDAISSKAQEIIISASRQGNSREKDKMIQEAILLCKDVAAKLNLDVLVSHLVAVHAYLGVVDICLASAAKKDPQNLALHFYKNGEPNEDQQGMQAFINRSHCYKHVMSMLKRLISVPPCTSSTSTSDPHQLLPSEASQHAEQVLDFALRSDDQLFHVELYQWLLAENDFDRLLSIRSAFLEEFLTRGTTQHPESHIMLDLLWKYYEKNRNYKAAAKILAKLAEKHSTDIDLNKRIEYLSRAVVCVKSDELGIDAHHLTTGDLLHDLEEKMEVARVQLQLLDAILTLPATSETTASISQLNADLLDISQLYSDFAEPYALWECQLAILHCAGHPDQMLVQTIWTNILDNEINHSVDRPAPIRVTLISNKIKHLGKLYASSQKYFPLEHIVRSLEVLSVQLKVDCDWVFKTMLSIGLPLSHVFDVYNKLYCANEPIWLTYGSPNHLLLVMANLLDLFSNSATIVPAKERRHFIVRCLDCVGHCLGNLYTKHDSNNLVQHFKAIQAKLERL